MFRKLFAEKLRGAGLKVYQDEEFYELEAEAMVELLCRRIEAWDQEPGVLLLGGECPVKVSGTGKGGRCTHLALLLAKRMEGRKGFSFMALATDGTDGPTDAAGAIVDGATAGTIADLEQAINRCDSYSALERVGALLKTGATGTNVNDVYVVYFGLNVKR
jgi:hydroxypyruvate reductase